MGNTQGRNLWLGLHVATLVVALGVLVFAGRGQWFFGDEWAFLLHRGLRNPRWDLLHPHNEHWSTLPILWYRALFNTVGLKSYWPYLSSVFALHLLAAHCVWRLMRSAGVAPAIATAMTTPFVFYGAGWENLTWAFQIGFVGSLAAGLALVLLVDDNGGKRRVGLVAAGAIGALMLSGISVVMVAAVGLAALARWGWRKALLVVLPSAAVYALWSVFPGRVGLTGSSEFRGQPDDIPRFGWGGLSATLGGPFRSDYAGQALLVVLGVVLVLRGRDWWRRAPGLLALAAAAPVMFVVISQGRGAFQDPASPRYMYLAAGMLAPMCGFAVQQLVAHERRRRILVFATCATLGVVGANELIRAARPERTRELALKGQLLASRTVAESETTLSDRPDFAYYRRTRVSDLVELERTARLPGIVPTARDLAFARLALQVRVGRGRAAVDVVSATAAAPPGARVRARGACATVDLRGGNAVIERAAAAPAVFSLTASGAGAAHLFVPFAGGNAGPRTIALKPRRTVTITEVVDGALLLQTAPGSHTVCGLAWTNAT